MATILIVEDHPDLRQLLARFLTTSGYQVITAPDGLAALQEMRRAAPDVVITDLRMPRLDGRQLVSLLRQRDPQLPVVVMTAGGEDVAFGDVPVLLRPFPLATLRATLQRLLPHTHAPRPAA